MTAPQHITSTTCADKLARRFLPAYDVRMRRAPLIAASAPAVCAALLGLSSCNVAAPIVGIADNEGSVTQALAAGVTLTDTGTIEFTDDTDAELVHTVSVAPVTASPEGSLSAVLTTDLTAGGPAVVTWTYTLDNELVRSLRFDQTQLETFWITIHDGTHASTVDVSVTIQGTYDPIRTVCVVAGPDDVLLDFNDPNPTTWDATGCYESPDGYPLQYSWSAQSSVTVPSHPAFVANQNVLSVATMNHEWGFNSQGRIDLAVLDPYGPVVRDYRADFFVTDAG